MGFFNPLLPKDKKERVGLEAERIKYWLGQGAQPTTRVARILGENELMPMPANGNNPKKAVPKKERKKEGEEAPAAPKAAPAEAPKEAAPATEAAPAEAAPAAAPKEAAPATEAAPAEAAPAEAPKEAAPAAEAPKEEQK